MGKLNVIKYTSRTNEVFSLSQIIAKWLIIRTVIALQGTISSTDLKYAQIIANLGLYSQHFSLIITYEQVQ
jgi:hypothetical protein